VEHAPELEECTGEPTCMGEPTDKTCTGESGKGDSIVATEVGTEGGRIVPAESLLPAESTGEGDHSVGGVCGGVNSVGGVCGENVKDVKSSGKCMGSRG